MIDRHDLHPKVIWNHISIFFADQWEFFFQPLQFSLRGIMWFTAIMCVLATVARWHPGIAGLLALGVWMGAIAILAFGDNRWHLTELMDWIHLVWLTFMLLCFALIAIMLVIALLFVSGVIA